MSFLFIRTLRHVACDAPWEAKSENKIIAAAAVPIMASLLASENVDIQKDACLVLSQLVEYNVILHKTLKKVILFFSVMFLFM